MTSPAVPGVRLGHHMHVSVEAVRNTGFDLFATLEDKSIRELASKAHADGLQFDGWPKFQRIPLVYGMEGIREARVDLGEKADVWELRATVIGVPRNP